MLFNPDLTIAGIFIWIYIVFLAAVLFVSVGIYVLKAVGLMNMAKKCGIEKGWLAFVPFGHEYIHGRIAEKLEDGKPSSKRYSRILTGLSIALCAVYVLCAVACFWSLFAQMSAIHNNSGDFVFAISAFSFLPLSVALLAIVVVYYVFSSIALYRIYKIFSPENAVLYLLLSIFISAASPIVILILSRKNPVCLKREYYPGTYYDPGCTGGQS